MRILLTGGTGRLGQCLVPELSKADDVIVDAPAHSTFDLERPTDMWDYLNTIPLGWKQHYTAVVHCAAMTDVPGCEQDLSRAHTLNALGTSHLANFCSRLGLYFVYISTDYVFDGELGNYSEEHAPNPINVYGQTKLCGEVATKIAYHFFPERYAILRTSLKALGEWPYPRAFTDIYSSADYVDIIAREIALAIRLQVTGVLHIATERKSIYELAKRRTPTVQPMSRKEIKDVKLPFDVSLDISKWTGLKQVVEEQYRAAR